MFVHEGLFGVPVVVICEFYKKDFVCVEPRHIEIGDTKYKN